MIAIRAAKAATVAAIALFASLVTFGNLTDYNTNFVFVEHVLAMDTIFPFSTIKYRAITSPAFAHAAYALIIAAEAAKRAGLGLPLAQQVRQLEGFAKFLRAQKGAQEPEPGAEGPEVGHDRVADQDLTFSDVFLVPMSEFNRHHCLKGLNCATHGLIKNRIHNACRLTE